MYCTHLQSLDVTSKFGLSQTWAPSWSLGQELFRIGGPLPEMLDLKQESIIVFDCISVAHSFRLVVLPLLIKKKKHSKKTHKNHVRHVSWAKTEAIDRFVPCFFNFLIGSPKDQLFVPGGLRRSWLLLCQDRVLDVSLQSPFQGAARELKSHPNRRSETCRCLFLRKGWQLSTKAEWTNITSNFYFYQRNNLWKNCLNIRKNRLTILHFIFP